MNINLTVIIVSTLVCLTAIQLYAIHVGLNGTILSTTVGIFAVIIGASAKAIYDKTKKSQ